MITDDFELRLIKALQPIRNFFLARVIEFSLSSGLLELLGDGEPKPVTEIADRLGFAPDRTRGLLRYLANEGIVSDPGTKPSLTSAGTEYLTFRPWFELLIGGYADTLGDLPAVLADPAVYAGRHGAMVGVGSCGISRYDAIPMVRRLLFSLPQAPDTIVDLGCGDGTFLLELCDRGTKGIGVDPNESGIEIAREKARATGRADELSFVVAGAEDFLARGADLPSGTVCYICAFSLQEVLEQRGRAAVVELVRAALGTAGDSWLAVVEVDHRPDDPLVMRHGLGTAYYNPYYLLHEVTEQRLETTDFWRELFAEAGAGIEAWLTPDDRVDSTRLEFGCLLSSAGRPPGELPRPSR